MKFSFTNEVKKIVADTYLAYSSDIDGADAFNRFVSRSKPLLDVTRDPSFSTFTDDELIDEMILLEQDITVLFNQYLQLIQY